MQYMLMLYVNEGGWQHLTDAEKAQGTAAYTACTEALKGAGTFLAGGRLRPSATATTVRTNEGAQQVLDGPYADSKEQLGGYYLLDVPDLDAALLWAARCPAASHGVVEVRPVWPTSA